MFIVYCHPSEDSFTEKNKKARERTDQPMREFIIPINVSEEKPAWDQTESGELHETAGDRDSLYCDWNYVGKPDQFSCGSNYLNDRIIFSLGGFSGLD